jgi:hypothetical protein
LVGGTSNIIPFRRPFFFLIQLFADLWKQMGMKALLNKAGFSKRSGAPIYELIYVLVLWGWLKKDSIGMFARESRDPRHLFSMTDFN